MTIHLDANFLVRVEQAASAEARQLRQWIKAGHVLQVSSVAWSEYCCGSHPAPTPESERRAMLLEAARQICGEPIPLTGSDAELAARLFNLGNRRSRSLPDCQIAAVAIRCRARLATLNWSDFDHFKSAGLLLAEAPRGQ
jgi:predicted nucleic acid-binding protein